MQSLSFFAIPFRSCCQTSLLLSCIEGNASELSRGDETCAGLDVESLCGSILVFWLSIQLLPFPFNSRHLVTNWGCSGPAASLPWPGWAFLSCLAETWTCAGQKLRLWWWLKVLPLTSRRLPTPDRSYTSPKQLQWVRPSPTWFLSVSVLLNSLSWASHQRWRDFSICTSRRSWVLSSAEEIPRMGQSSVVTWESWAAERTPAAVNLHRGQSSRWSTEDRMDVTVQWVGELTWHSVAEDQLLPNTCTKKCHFPHLPFPVLLFVSHLTPSLTCFWESCIKMTITTV